MGIHWCEKHDSYFFFEGCQECLDAEADAECETLPNGFCVSDTCKLHNETT